MSIIYFYRNHLYSRKELEEFQELEKQYLYQPRKRGLSPGFRFVSSFLLAVPLAPFLSKEVKMKIWARHTSDGWTIYKLEKKKFEGSLVDALNYITTFYNVRISNFTNKRIFTITEKKNTYNWGLLFSLILNIAFFVVLFKGGK